MVEGPGDSKLGGDKKAKTKSSPAAVYKENKKVFTCTFDGCAKGDFTTFTYREGFKNSSSID